MLRDKKSGFTLVEAIVAMALMALLAAASGSGIYGYFRYARWRRANEYARTIYLAAQARITGSSQLEGGNLPWTEDADIWQGGPKEEGYFLEGRGRKTKGDGGDYGRYLAGELDEHSPKDQGIRILYQMIDPYIPDKSILIQGTIRLCLDPESRQVTAVFYSADCPDGLSFGEDGDGFVFSESVRKERLIGCFEAGRGNPFPQKEDRPMIREAKMEQDEEGRLTLSWRLESEEIRDWKGLTYQIMLYGWDGDEGQKLCTIFLNLPKENGFCLPVPGILGNLSLLDSMPEFQVVQALVVSPETEEWRCFLLRPEEKDFRFTLVLEEEGGRASESDARPFFSLSGLLEQRGWENRKAGVSAAMMGWGNGRSTTAVRESGTEWIFVRGDEGTEPLQDEAEWENAGEDDERNSDRE